MVASLGVRLARDHQIAAMHMGPLQAEQTQKAQRHAYHLSQPGEMLTARLPSSSGLGQSR